VLDTTGVGYFKAGTPAPTIDELNELLSAKHAIPGMKVIALAEEDVPKAEVVYAVNIVGLSSLGTAVEARNLLSKVEGVIRVHPDGTTGRALVFVKDRKAVDGDKIREALKASVRLRFQKMEIAKL